MSGVKNSFSKKGKNVTIFLSFRSDERERERNERQERKKRNNERKRSVHGGLSDWITINYESKRKNSFCTISSL